MEARKSYIDFCHNMFAWMRRVRSVSSLFESTDGNFKIFVATFAEDRGSGRQGHRVYPILLTGTSDIPRKPSASDPASSGIFPRMDQDPSIIPSINFIVCIMHMHRIYALKPLRRSLHDSDLVCDGASEIIDGEDDQL